MIPNAIVIFPGLISIEFSLIIPLLGGGSSQVALAGHNWELGKAETCGKLWYSKWFNPLDSNYNHENP